MLQQLINIVTLLGGIAVIFASLYKLIKLYKEKDDVLFSIFSFTRKNIISFKFFAVLIISGLIYSVILAGIDFYRLASHTNEINIVSKLLVYLFSLIIFLYANIFYLIVDRIVKIAEKHVAVTDAIVNESTFMHKTIFLLIRKLYTEDINQDIKKKIIQEIDELVETLNKLHKNE